MKFAARILFTVMGALFLSGAYTLAAPTTTLAQSAAPEISVQDYQAFNVSSDTVTWVTKVAQLNPGDQIVFALYSQGKCRGKRTDAGAL